MYEANVAYTNTDIEISEQLKSGRRLKKNCNPIVTNVAGR